MRIIRKPVQEQHRKPIALTALQIPNLCHSCPYDLHKAGSPEAVSPATDELRSRAGNNSYSSSSSKAADTHRSPLRPFAVSPYPLSLFTFRLPPSHCSR